MHEHLSIEVVTCNLVSVLKTYIEIQDLEIFKNINSVSVAFI